MNSPSPRLALTGLAAVSLAALGLVAWSLLPSDQGTTEPTAPTTAAPVPAAASATAATPSRHDAEVRHGFYSAPVGTVLTYDLDGTFEYGLGQAEAGRQVSGLVVKGGVEVAIVARPEAQILARIAFPGLQLSALGGHGTDQGSLGVAAQQPLLVKLDADGRVLGYQFAAQLTGEQRNFVRGLLAGYLHTVPADAPQTWEAADADAAGELVARFAHTASTDADLVGITRQKLRYTAMAGTELHPHTCAGGSRATFSRALGWLQHVAVDERMELRMEELGLQIDLASKLTFALRESRVEHVAAGFDLGAAFAPAAGHREDLSAGADAHVHARWEKELANTSLSQLIAELTALLQAQPIDAQAVDQAWQAVTWLVKLKPEVLAELREFVKGSAAERLVDTLVSALGAAGTEAAQATLAELRHDASANPKLRTSATVALFQVAKPSARVLGDVIGDIGGAGELTGDDALALLLLGALAPRAGDLAVDGRTAMTALLGFEAKAAEQGRLDLFANALGNSLGSPLGNAGGERAVPQVERLIGHQDDTVRAAAYHALRHVRTPAAAALLERGLGDTAAAVRTDAVIALGEHRTKAAEAALVRAARDDAEPSVRRAGVEALAGVAKPGTAARRALEHLAQADPDAEVRKAAATALEGLR